MPGQSHSKLNPTHNVRVKATWWSNDDYHDDCINHDQVNTYSYTKCKS